MTHDELLARIELWKKNVCLIPLKPKWLTGDCKCMTCVSLSALRAVVELHKPRVHIADCCKGTVNPMDCSESYIACEGCNIYPCQTIKAIEKELK